MLEGKSDGIGIVLLNTSKEMFIWLKEFLVSVCEDLIETYVPVRKYSTVVIY